MYILIKKTLRDFWRLKSEFISILVLAFLGIFLFIGLTNASNGMKYEFDNWSDESKLSDVWVTYNEISSRQYNNIKNILGVEDIQKQTVMALNVGEGKEGQIKLIIPETNTISMPTVIDGDDFNISEEGIWLDKEFANANKYEVGDKIIIWIDDDSVEYTIKGLILSSNYVSYTGENNNLVSNHNLYGYAYTTEQTFVEQNTEGTNQLLIKVIENADISELEEKFEEELSSDYIASTNRSNNSYISTYTQKTDTIKKMSIIISIVFFLLTFLTILTTMQRLVKNQQSIVGTFKALGFKNRTLLFHYSMYGFLVSVIGALLAVFIAPRLLTPIILELQKEQFMMINWQGRSSIIELVIATILVLSCSFVAMVAVNNMSRKLPANILREQTIQKTKKSFLEMFGGVWNRLSFEWKWVFRDISRNHKKTLIAIIGVIGSMVLLIASLSMQHSLETNNTNLYGNQYKYNYKIAFEHSASSEDKEDLLNSVQKKGQFISELSTNIKTARTSELSLLFIIEPGLYVELKNKDGEIIQLDNEQVIISNSLANELGITKGETIQIRPTGHSDYIAFTVTEIAYISSPQGIFISSSIWIDNGNEFSPTSLLVGKNINETEVKDYSYVKDIISITQQLDEGNTVLESIQAILITVAVIAVLLSWTVLYNLGTLNFTERFREYATMKVLGFNPSEIRAIILRDNILNFFIGWIFGIPAGLMFLRYFALQLSTSSSEILISIDVSSILISTLIVFACTIMISFMISSKIQKIDMIEALKSVE